MMARWEGKTASRGVIKQDALWTPGACPTGDLWEPVNKRNCSKEYLGTYSRSWSQPEWWRQVANPKMPDLRVLRPRQLHGDRTEARADGSGLDFWKLNPCSQHWLSQLWQRVCFPHPPSRPLCPPGEYFPGAPATSLQSKGTCRQFRGWSELSSSGMVFNSIFCPCAPASFIG